MTTKRVELDTRSANILTIFENNMSDIGALNQLAASPDNVGTYHGPVGSNEENVNINYPRDGASYNRIGREPSPYESYHVREIYLDQGVMTAGYSDDPDAATNPGMVTKSHNDGHTSHVAETKSDYSFHGRSNNLLNDYGAYSNEAGTADPSKFMKLKGRKSLLTLSQETRAAFFDDRERAVYRNPNPGWWRDSPNMSNKYGDGIESYDYKYMSEQGQSFVDAPSGIDFISQSLVGFNLGQVSGGNVTIEDRIKTEAQNISRNMLLNLGTQAGENQFIADYYNRLTAQLVPVERISQLYVPGWGRPAENWLTKKPLSENLNQNILLPPNSGEVPGMNPTDVPGNNNNSGSGIPGFGDNTATFQSLYTRNRSGIAGGVKLANPIFNNGMIAGTPINLLQEPAHITAAMIKADKTAPLPSTVNVPFTFEEDDAQYLTYAKRETGFTSNGPTTSTDPSRMEPAVKDIATTTTAGKPFHLGDTTVQMTQGQHFPFAFSTVNKRRGGQTRLQVCYLQAIINSLSESYTPTWNSKHFFGRTEQAHTYTFTDRTIDIGFTIFANEMRQLQNVYERVVWLAQQCYPDYDPGTSRMLEGPLVAMRVGDLFQYKAGIIRSLSYDWMFGTGKWELTSGVRMPQGCTVTMSYSVIHDNMPSRDTDFYGGPQGGLNSATERFRTIGGTSNAFDSFDDENGTTTSKVGFGSRFIDAGVKVDDLTETSFIEEIKAANQMWMMEENSKHDKRSINLAVPGGFDPTEER